MTYTAAPKRRGWCGPVIDGKAPSGKTAITLPRDDNENEKTGLGVHSRRRSLKCRQSSLHLRHVWTYYAEKQP
jgi:hypothetical protein